MSDISASEIEQQIREMLRHPSFRRLRWRSDRFRPMEAFGIASREHSHSDFLAFLLDPVAPHGLQDRFLRDFIALSADSPPITKDRQNPLPLGAELAIETDNVRIFRERYNIDVLIDCLVDGPVLGVEVKIWAGEQEDQIKRYQELLTVNYPNRSHLMVFLTPDGRPPDTGQEGYEVPCVSVSWYSVAELIDGLSDAVQNEFARPFIQEFSRHLKELTMGSKEDRQLVGRLFKDESMIKVFSEIDRIRPRFWDKEVLDRLCREGSRTISEVTDSEAVIDDKYEKKGDAKVPFQVKKWIDRGLPIRFLFYHCPTWSAASLPGFHVLVYEDDILEEDKRSRYLSIVQKCKGFAHELIRAQGWHKKYSVLANPRDGHDVGWSIPDESFDDEWISNAMGILREKVREVESELKNIPELKL